jgi:FKBP-type peptidyl-prolyl cis-trans isomerase
MKLTAVAVLLLTTVAAMAQAPAAAPITIQAIPAPPDVAAPPDNASQTVTGLATRVLTPGTGKERPSSTDIVTVHYTGWTTDGKMFDSSISRGRPSTFPLDRVISGWSEAVQLMVTGEKRRAWIPERLAYQGKEGKPKGMLVFDIELISISPSPTKAPADVSGPPKDSSRTVSGLVYKSLQPGTGTAHPKSSSTVTVHYTGWTTDGKMFDSSVVRGQPATFGLGKVIPGWTEGLQLMVEGQKMRFWIPENLAYKGMQPPYGMLVFDVELIKIQ